MLNTKPLLDPLEEVRLGVLGWFVNGRLLKQKVPPRGQLQVFNKIVPIIRWVEQKFRPPVGLSLVIVARKNIVV